MIRWRVDDFPGTKPEEFSRHNLENFKLFHEVMRRRSVRYLLGVIPKHVSAEDLTWLGAQPEIDVALHGINHDERFPNEFRDWELEEDVFLKLTNERYLMEEGLLFGNWKERKLVTAYIPPHNVVDKKTIRALVRSGFRELHVGPGTEDNLELSAYATLNGIHVVPSFPPFYGRSDELLQRGSVPIILKEDRERMNSLSSKEEVCIGLHWTWETNIGLENLDRFLTEIFQGAI